MTFKKNFFFFKNEVTNFNVEHVFAVKIDYDKLLQINLVIKH